MTFSHLSSPPSALKGCQVKVRLAEKHLADLYLKNDAMLRHEDHRVIGEFKPETSEYVFRMGGPLPTVEWGVILGQSVHLLRSALDNMLWQLVLLRGGTPGNRTQFPICSNEIAFHEKRMTFRGVSAKDRALLREAQPFHGEPSRPELDSLALLQYFDNVDKHQVIPLVFGFVGSWWSETLAEDPYVPVKDIENYTLGRPPVMGPQERAELARFKLVASGPDPEMKVNGEPVVVVGVAHPGRMFPLSLHDLGRVRDRVEEIFDIFYPFWPEDSLAG
jgi:hypothetical protein